MAVPAVAVDPAVAVELVVLAVEAVATTKLAMTVQQVLVETPVPTDQVARVVAPTLDLVDPVVKVAPVAKAVPAVTAVTGGPVAVPEQPVTLVPREILVTLAVTATAPTVLAVVPEVVVLLDLVDPVVDLLVPTSLIVVPSHSLTMALWPVTNRCAFFQNWHG
jgi:hypothetical protein